MSDTVEFGRARVAASLRRLERLLAQLADALGHCAGTFSVGTPAPGLSPARQIAEAYLRIDLGPDDVPNCSVVCLGVAGVERRVVSLAESVNEAKLDLRSVCAPLQRARVRVAVRGAVGGTRATKSVPVIRAILRNLQRSDLNLLAAYRRIPVLSGRPARIAYTQALTRSVYRKSVVEIARLLERSDRPGAAADRARLTMLGASEVPLALVRSHYANVRANVTFASLDARGRGRLQLAAELPLLYALGRSTEPPLVDYGDRAPRRSELGRQPRRPLLEAVPFLETLPAYRYLDPPRRAGGRAAGA